MECTRNQCTENPEDSFIVSLILTASSFFRTVLLPELVAQWFSDSKKDLQNKVDDLEPTKESSIDSAAALVPFV